MKRRVLIDMDGVICNFVDAFMYLYAEKGGKIPDGFAWVEWNSMDELPSQDVRKEVWRDPDLFWLPKPYEGAIVALQALNEQFDVRIVTALPHKHVHTRSDWVKHYAPFIHRKNQMIFTNDKSLIRGDVIIDDKLEYVRDWLKINARTGVVIDRPWNQTEGPENFIRVSELWEFAERVGVMWAEGENNVDCA